MPIGSPTWETIIEEMVRRIVQGFQPDRVILFGSHARGTATRDSDVDLLVVLPVSGSIRNKRIEIRAALHGVGLPKDVVVITPRQLRASRSVPGTLIGTALREGKVLYERQR
jgi:predicted nucleotidyltransferase